MGNFQQSGVNFTIENNFQTGEKKHPVKGKLVSAWYNYADYTQDDASKLFNAVEIDWNSADLANATAKWPSGTATINTTGVFIL